MGNHFKKYFFEWDRSIILMALSVFSACTNPFNLQKISSDALSAGVIDSAPAPVQSPTPVFGTVSPVPDYFSAIQNSVANSMDILFSGKTTDTGDAIVSVQVINQPAHGSIVVSGTSLTFVPTAGYTGSDTFTYQVVGQNGSQSSGTIRLEVRKPHTWTGAGDNANWSNADNWVGGIPTATDTAYFDDGCLHCDVLVDATQAVGGVQTEATFQGTINLSNLAPLESQLNVGNLGFSFKKGTLNLGQGQIAVSGDVAFDDGTLNAQSGVFKAAHHVTLNPVMVLNAGNSTFEFNGSSGGNINTASFNLANVSFTHDTTGKSIVGNLNVQKKLYFNVTWDSVYGGTIVAMGDIEVNKMDRDWGTALIKIAGNSNQLIYGTANGTLPSLEIASLGGTVTFKDIVRIRKDFTYTSGVVDFNNVAYGPSTVEFTGSSSGGTITSNSTLHFANVSLTFDSGNKTLSGTLSVYNTLYINTVFGAVAGGQIDCYGDLTSVWMNESAGTFLVRLVGTGNQLITASSAGVITNLEIAKPSGLATVSGTLSVSKNFTYTSGSIDFNSLTYGMATTQFVGSATGGALTPGPIDFGNVVFSHDTAPKSMIGTMNVKGALTINTTWVWMSGGLIQVEGDTTVTKTGPGASSVGMTQLALTGANNQALSHNTAYEFPGVKLTVNKSGGTVNLLTNVSLSNSQNLDITTTGNVLLNGLDLDGNGVFNCYAGTVTAATGRLWITGTTSNSGCTLN